MCKTIKQKVRFSAGPAEIYRLLVDTRQHAALTGQRAQISRKVGGAFTTRNGHVRGINIELVPAQRLVQAWRTKDFPPGIFSMAAFELTETASGGTELVLTHRGVPKDLIPEIEQDWRDFYWKKIRDRRIKG